MRCTQVHKHASAYLDGDLDAERSGALRGHLRGCGDCADHVGELAQLVRAAADINDVDAVDPPGGYNELWQRIGDRLAEEEIADAERAPVWLRLRAAWHAILPYRAHLVVATALVALITTLAVRRQLEQPIAAEVSPSDMGIPNGQANAARVTDLGAAVFAADGNDETHLEAALREVREADDRYLTAIGELREIADSERTSWSAPQRERFDREVAAFEKRAAQLLEKTPATADSRRRDPLYQLYRRHIAFLEDMVFGQFSLLSGGSR